MSDLIEPDKVRKFWPQLEVIGIDKALVCDKKTSDFSMEIPLLLEEGVGDEKGRKAKTNEKLHARDVTSEFFSKNPNQNWSSMPF
ncbi:hypothetical protein niasHT_018421 [Heterodera trifolii]|uniref:Uncharacterized protein n=1 Tax=Heterodera trifolii TaxID=157864 RepID=A0ABD2KXA2_9BILA